MSNISHVAAYGCIVYFCAVSPAALGEAPDKSAEALEKVEPSMALLFLLEGAKSNTDYFKSGKGKAVWEVSSKNSGLQKKSIVSFVFSGVKLRWDRKFVSGSERPEQRDAYNGVVRYRYLKQHLDGTPGFESNAYILAPADSSKQVDIQGAYVDMKAMSTCVMRTADALLAALRSDPSAPFNVTVDSVRRTQNNTVEARITVKILDDPPKLVLTFAPRMGWSIVEEEWQNSGTRSSILRRSFKKHGDAWFIDSIEYEGFITGRIVKVVVEDFEPNVDVNDGTFEVSGLGVPENTRVWDQVAGVNYKYKPDILLESLVGGLDRHSQDDAGSDTEANENIDEPEEQSTGGSRNGGPKGGAPHAPRDLGTISGGGQSVGDQSTAGYPNADEPQPNRFRSCIVA